MKPAHPAPGNWRGMRLALGDSVQNSNPFPNLSSVPFPYCLHDSLARAYVRARESSAGTAPTASDIFAAFAHAHEPEQPSGATAVDSDEATAVAGLVDIAELLSVMREPIAWVFTLAERRAEGDPVDLAAIDRVRDAALHRVDAIIADTAPADAPRIRATDVLTVASLLVGTLDPAIIARAAQIVGGGITDTLSALLPLVPTIASEFVSTPHACGGAHTRPPVGPPWYAEYLAHVATPFADGYSGPLGGSYPGPLGGAPGLRAHVLRAVVPPWPWLHAALAL
jgi:hypothetical protein